MSDFLIKEEILKDIVNFFMYEPMPLVKSLPHYNHLTHLQPNISNDKNCENKTAEK